MSDLLDSYKTLLGAEVVDQLYQFGAYVKGIKVVHINSTKEGGGVAEILTKMTPLMNAIGIDTRWEVIQGNPSFFECTKTFHNLLQGREGLLPDSNSLRGFEETAAKNAEELRPILEQADIVVIHDPQPLPLITHFPGRKGKWIWRCHIDVSSPSRPAWKYLRKYIEKFDASIFSLADFARPLPHPIFLIAPSIDPFSEKNMELDRDEIAEVHKRYGIDSQRPNILQVSRFDRFKDPLGVIEAYRLAKKYNPTLQLILAGGGATDDPESEIVLKEVMAAANDPDIHVLFLPSNAHRIVNALQRGSDIVLQKSKKEGFGLTVAEALWKMKPVIGGNSGGIRLQVIDHRTGYLVNTPEGAALRIRYLLQNPEKAKELGSAGKRLVKENFLITRNFREYLTLFATLLFPNGDRFDLSEKKP